MFSEKEASEMFLKYNLIFDANAIDMRSQIDKYQNIIEYNIKQGRDYRDADIKLNIARRELQKYEHQRHTEFARATIEAMLSKRANPDMLYAYFGGLIRTTNAKNISRKQNQLVEFARIAVMEMEKINPAILYANQNQRN